MPTWPTTKAGTTHLDAGSDNPGSARADIKQNVDNVNDMIDTIVVNSPTANQILAYDSTDSRFENVDASSVVSSGAVSAVATVDSSGNIEWTTSYVKLSATEGQDAESIISVSSDVITVVAGTYLIFVETETDLDSVPSGATFEMRVRDTTNTATLKTVYATDDKPWTDVFFTTTFSGSTNLELQGKRSTGAAYSNISFHLLFQKI